jgi:hypothetical protein
MLLPGGYEVEVILSLISLPSSNIFSSNPSSLTRSFSAPTSRTPCPVHSSLRFSFWASHISSLPHPAPLAPHPQPPPLFPLAPLFRTPHLSLNLALFRPPVDTKSASKFSSAHLQDPATGQSTSRLNLLPRYPTITTLVSSQSKIATPDGAP